MKDETVWIFPGDFHFGFDFKTAPPILHDDIRFAFPVSLRIHEENAELSEGVLFWLINNSF